MEITYKVLKKGCTRGASAVARTPSVYSVEILTEKFRVGGVRARATVRCKSVCWGSGPNRKMQRFRVAAVVGRRVAAVVGRRVAVVARPPVVAVAGWGIQQQQQGGGYSNSNGGDTPPALLLLQVAPLLLLHAPPVVAVAGRGWSAGGGEFSALGQRRVCEFWQYTLGGRKPRFGVKTRPGEKKKVLRDSNQAGRITSPAP